jgi:hypothetical protein
MNDGDQAGALTINIEDISRDRYTADMINLLLLSLSLANIRPAKTAQIRPCVWPNTCKTAPAPVVAQFRPCVWPNVCKSEAPIVEIAQFTTCVFPRKCAANS